MNDLSFIKGALAVTVRGNVFALINLAGNIEISVRQLEDFLLRGKDLPSEVIHKLVAELFNGAKVWDAEAQSLIDVTRPADAMLDARQLPRGVVNSP